MVPKPAVRYAVRVFRKILFGLGASCVVVGCDTVSTVPIDVQIQDGTLVPGARWNQLQVTVKSLPGAELRVGNETKSMDATRATETFLVPKADLHLGKNVIVAHARIGALFSKKESMKTSEWVADPKTLLHFEASPSGDAEALTCQSTMCGSPLRVTKTGRLPIEVESAIPGTLIMAGSKAEVAPGRRTALDLDVVALLGARNVGEVTQLAIPFSFEAGGAKGDDVLEVGGAAVSDLAARIFAQVEERPIVIPGDVAPREAKRNLLLVVGAPTSKLIAVGKPGKFADVDLVGVAKKSERSFACGADSEILYNDLEVHVVDRRTAKTIGTKKLLADRVSCPPTVTGKITGDVREDDVRHVLSEFLTK